MERRNRWTDGLLWRKKVVRGIGMEGGRGGGEQRKDVQREGVMQ